MHHSIFLHILAESEPTIDGGVCGSFVHYALIIALVGSAFLIFLYLWKKGKLDMDEDPKIQMLKDDEPKDKPHE
jgi:hypothetical protein